MQTRPSASRRRFSAAGRAALVTAGLAVLGAGCGSSVTKPSLSAIEAKLRSDTGSDLPKSLTAEQFRCISAVIREFGSAAALRNYVEGRIGVDAIKTTGTSALETDIRKCVG